MKTKKIMLCTVALTIGNYSAYAGDSASSSGQRYTPRADIYQNNYTQEERQQDRMDIKSYEQYEQREPCQNYRQPPRNYSAGCVSNIMEEEIVVASAAEPDPLPIVSSYTVLFDFDKFGLRNNEDATLDRAMNEIKKYNPTQVTVTGYTDSQGKADYNQKLSSHREQTVSSALLKRGITNQTLNREARGEYEQAVKTADGVKNQENRRVVIDFRR